MEPTEDDRKNFASELANKWRAEEPKCRIWAFGLEHRAIMFEHTPDVLYESITTGRVVPSLQLKGFRWVVAVSTSGSVFFYVIPEA
jgi:hypothetical protein